MPPFTIVVIAVAVTPAPIIFSFCTVPREIVEIPLPELPERISSMKSTPVSITSSSYLNNSHFKV
jgi:hypothetical protein